MIPRNVKWLLLAILVAACTDQPGVLEPNSSADVVAQGNPPNLGRVVTSLTISGRAAPGTVSSGAGSMLTVAAGGFTTFDQGNPTWLSTSITFTSTSDGSLTSICDDTNVWAEVLVPGFGLTVSFSVAAPSIAGSYLVTVLAHQEDACTAVSPSEPFPAPPDQFTLNVNQSNSAPVLISIGTQAAAEGTRLSFTATATDADVPAQTLNFTLANAASGVFPAGATISQTGTFSWTPSEDQGPGTYRAKIVVSDGSLTDDEEFTITVSETNSAPVLSLPSDIITQWGVPLPNVVASANDPDEPANTLTFTKISGPSWVAVNAGGSISFSAISATDVGSHAIRVAVTDDGSPSMSDAQEFTITVQMRPATLTYQGSTSGQYSDKALFSATLVDGGVGSMNGALIANASIDFRIAGASVGSAATNGSGVASGAFAIINGAGSYPLLVDFAGALGYSSSSASSTFAVSREDAALNATFPGSGQTGSDLVVTVSVKELLANGLEPAPNAEALAGDVGKVALVAATLSGVNSGNQYQATCGTGSGGSASYASSQDFICTFNGSTLNTADVYQLQVSLPASDPFFQAASFTGTLSIGDQNSGSASGGGTFRLDGDLVIFAFISRPNGSNGPRSHMLVLRHLKGGGICRMKNSEPMEAGVVGLHDVALSGVGDYVCHGSLGKVTTSFSGVTIKLFALDNGSVGAGTDRIWISNNAPATPNLLAMPEPPTANSVALTFGNVRVRRQ